MLAYQMPFIDPRRGETYDKSVWVVGLVALDNKRKESSIYFIGYESAEKMKNELGQCGSKQFNCNGERFEQLFIDGMDVWTKAFNFAMEVKDNPRPTDDEPEVGASPETIVDMESENPIPQPAMPKITMASFFEEATVVEL